MAINEVFPNPTVKQVIFQVRFPNLFSMESLVGEYQRRIMARFPESTLVFARQLVFAAGNTQELDLEQLNANPKESEPVQKIWKFQSGTGVELNIQTNSLDMSSTKHKTYENSGDTHRFKDEIAFAVSNFLEVTQIPLFSRIGLRYIDDCPVPGRNTRQFQEYYNSTLCLDRFPLEDALELQLVSRVTRGDHFLTFRESLTGLGNEAKLILDFDGSAKNVPASDYLPVTDRLHEIILEEFEKAIKKPVYDHMRQVPEDKQ